MVVRLRPYIVPIVGVVTKNVEKETERQTGNMAAPGRTGKRNKLCNVGRERQKEVFLRMETFNI